MNLFKAIACVMFRRSKKLTPKKIAARAIVLNFLKSKTYVFGWSGICLVLMIISFFFTWIHLVYIPFVLVLLLVVTNLPFTITDEQLRAMPASEIAHTLLYYGDVINDWDARSLRAELSRKVALL